MVVVAVVVGRGRGGSRARLRGEGRAAGRCLPRGLRAGRELGLEASPGESGEPRLPRPLGRFELSHLGLDRDEQLCGAARARA